jgi:hypothetical protein
MEFPSRFVGRVFFSRLSVSDERAIGETSRLVSQSLGLEIAWIESLMKRELSRFLYLLPRVRRILTDAAPKLLVEVVWYTRMNKVFNVAARELGIPILELQHGTISPYHHGYSFPKGVSVKAVPDYIAVWGEFWKQQCGLPIPSDQIVVTGFPFYESNVPILRRAKRSGAHILVVSQGTIGRALAEAIANIASEPSLRDVTFHFKPHPSESALVSERYAVLSQNPNVRIVFGPGSDSLEDLFQLCDTQIGVYSTALVEGMRFGLRTIIYQLQGWEYFESLRGQPSIEFASDLQSLVRVILEKRNTSEDNEVSAMEFMWAPDPLRKTVSLVRKLACE